MKMFVWPDMAGIESTGIDPLAEVIAINDSRILYHPLTFKYIEPKVYSETHRLFSVANIPKQKIKNKKK